MKIRVENPVKDGPSYLGLERAERFVRTGRAVWRTAISIRFVESDSRHRAAQESALRTIKGYDNDNRIRTATEIGNIPILFPNRLR